MMVTIDLWLLVTLCLISFVVGGFLFARRTGPRYY